MYIIAGSDVGAHVQGRARVWEELQANPSWQPARKSWFSNHKELDSANNLKDFFFFNFIGVELIYNVESVSGVSLKDLRSGFFPRSSR